MDIELNGHYSSVAGFVLWLFNQWWKSIR